MAPTMREVGVQWRRQIRIRPRWPTYIMSHAIHESDDGEVRRSQVHIGCERTWEGLIKLSEDTQS
jgi:hypothetical protein